MYLIGILIMVRMTKAKINTINILKDYAMIEPTYPNPNLRSITQSILELDGCIPNSWGSFDDKVIRTRGITVLRTLHNLEAEGIVYMFKVKIDENSNRDSCFITRYEYNFGLTADRDRVETNKEVTLLYNKVTRAKNGMNFLGGIMDQGLPTETTTLLYNQCKMLMQRLHPDKIEGYEDEFKLVLEAYNIIKTGIPLPIKMYTAGTNPKLEVFHITNK